MSTEADQALLELERRHNAPSNAVGTSIIGPRLDKVCRDIGSEPERTINTEFD